MLFSKTCQYAILAMTYLAEQQAGQLVSIREISEEANIPAPFLGKIVTMLSRAGLISARRGPNGGAMLSRPADKVIVGDIVEAIEGSFSSQRCVLGLPECNNRNPCPLHAAWKQLKVQLDKELHGLSLRDLVRSRREGA